MMPDLEALLFEQSINLVIGWTLQQDGHQHL